MNFNASGPRHPSATGRKLLKRPTETPGLDNSANFISPQPAYNPYENQPFGNVPRIYDNFPQNYNNIQQNQSYTPNNYGRGFPPGVGPGSMGYSMPVPPGTGPTLNMPSNLFSDPLVANVAMSYGSKIMGSGKELVDREIEKYVPVSRLKYYFAVDTSYVLSKLKLLFFPFPHQDWSVKYEQNEPVQPRYEVNAPDLYIPVMAYVTYVLVAGMALGTQNRFAPEVLGMLASSALAWTVVEILVALVTLYITNIQTKLRTLDLIAYSGYKYVGSQRIVLFATQDISPSLNTAIFTLGGFNISSSVIITAVLLSIVFKNTGYYFGLLYSGFALAFFMMRSLKWQVLEEVTTSADAYNPYLAGGHKRRMYFLMYMSCIQPLLMWWLSAHLKPPPLPPIPPNLVNA